MSEQIQSLDAASVKAWGQAVTAWLTPLIAVVGWQIVSRQANDRETRKEARSGLDRVIKLVDGAAEVCAQVFAPKNGVDSNENSVEPVNTWEQHQSRWRLKAEYAKLSVAVQSLRDQGISSDDATDALVALRSISMGGDFDTTEQKPWSVDDPRWTKLSGEGVRLVAVLEAAYKVRFNSAAKGGGIRSKNSRFDVFRTRKK